MIKVLSCLMLLLSGVAQSQSNSCGLPPRTSPSSVEWSSNAFYMQNNQPSTGREVQIVRQVLMGNVPESYRHFQVLRIPATIAGTHVFLEIDVAPDYLTIGTDQDFVRTPLTPFAAQYLASTLGYVLPTGFLVDRVYDQADTKLVPQPTNWFRDSRAMRLGSNYLLFNQTIENQRQGRGGLIAGHKKDVVVTNKLDAQPTRVAIYGWQEPGNKPLQSLGVPHEYSYEDYSHGIRFLGPYLRIVSAKGVTQMNLSEALRDRVFGSILNGGTPLHDVRAGRACTSEFARSMGIALANCPPQPKLCP